MVFNYPRSSSIHKSELTSSLGRELQKLGLDNEQQFFPRKLQLAHPPPLQPWQQLLP